MSTSTLLVGILPPSTLRLFEAGPVKKYTLCVCLKKHSITNRNIICFKEITLILIYHLVSKNQPNTNIIRSEKSPEYEYEYEKKSPEYEYKYYSV